MIKHIPFIRVIDESTDPHSIIVQDLTHYESTLPIENRILEIQIPGADKEIIVPFAKSKVNVYDTVLMDISSTRLPLPDGPYVFTFSMAPNNKLQHKVYHFRTAALRANITGVIINSFLYTEKGIDDCGNVLITKKQNLLMHAVSLLQCVNQIGKEEALIDLAYQYYAQAQAEMARASMIINSKEHV